MKVLNCNISIGEYIFTYVKKLEIETSWKMLTDTAVITLPSNVKDAFNHNKLSKAVKAGDPVVISIGYDEELVEAFRGYVTHVAPRVPVQITCEDEMWKLKQNNIVDSGKKQYLNDLLAKHFPNYTINAINVEIGKYYIDNISGAKFLEALKKDFGLYSFFRGNTLCVGKRYDRNTSGAAKFKLDYNIAKDDLEFKAADQVKLKIRAISNNSNGTKTEVELGDPAGESRTLNFYNLSKAELQAAAEREKERLIYDGWRGSFKAFGEPFVKHGDIVTLEHNEESDKTGKYWVDAVKYTFGTDGFRQEIKLGSVA